MRRLATALFVFAVGCDDLPSEDELRENFRVHRERIETLQIMADEDRARLCGLSEDTCAVTVQISNVDTTKEPPSYKVVDSERDAERIPFDRLDQYAVFADAVPSNDLHLRSDADRFSLLAARSGLSVGGTLYRYVHDPGPDGPVYDKLSDLVADQAERSFRAGYIRLEDDWYIDYRAS